MLSRLPTVAIGVKLGGNEPLLAPICLAFATAILWSFSRAWHLRSRRDEPRPPRVLAAIGEMRGKHNQSKMTDRLRGKLLIMGGRAMVQAYAKPSSVIVLHLCKKFSRKLQ